MKSKVEPKKKDKKIKKPTVYSSFIDHIYTLNSSKFFTGVIILTLNISSKYVTLGLSSTQEEYLKYTLGRQILVFAIIWMGTRDIVIALILTCVFMLFADYLFNDNSMYCVIPQKYMDKMKHDDEKQISNKDINDAIDLLKQARSQKQKNSTKSVFQDMYIHKGLYKENFI